MKNVSFLALIFGIFLVASVSAQAADFCVSNSYKLQSALTAAGFNGEDDVIKIVQGTYSGNFIYTSREAYDLTIEGGYSED